MASDPFKYFRIEARELLEQLGKGVLELERGDARGPELVPTLLRLAHTLKGAARVVKQREIAELVHAVEDALAPYRDGAAPLPRERIDATLGLLDAIGTRLAALASPGATGAPGAPAAAPRPAEDPPFRALRADVAELDALLEGIAETQATLTAMQKDLAGLEQACRVAERIAAPISAPGAAPAEALAETSRAAVDELRGLVVRAERSLRGGVELAERELGQVREAAERMRLVPAKTVSGALERTARDAAQSVGKRVSFVARGDDVRLDAHVLGVVQGALVQLVRNAVAHGVEGEAERASRGKPAEGHIELEVTRRGRRVSFVVRDDGGGVDLEAVRRAVRARGLSSADASRLGAEDLLRLLLEGGISTAERVTAIAGRGVGLDVVREAASRLGGEVSARTEAGRGTSIELSVPTSLSSLDVLVAVAGGARVAVPLRAVRQATRIGAAEIARAAEGETVLREGLHIAFVPLSRMLGAEGGVAPERAQIGSALVLEGSASLAAFGVERLLGTAHVVLRPLPEFAPADPVVAGVSLDAEGNPQLVLDPDALVAAAWRLPPPDAAPGRARRPILVVDDSLTTRMLEQSILESAGYEVDTASSGEEGLEKARQRPYALILVDVEMPGIDGFTFLERCRADPLLRDVPAILVTSRNAPEDRLRGQQAGARAHIVKSEFDQAGLLAQIRAFVG